MKRRRTLSSKASSWLFILPALTVVILLLLYPVTSSIFYSLTNKNLIKPTYRFLGLDNYIKTLTDPGFLDGLLERPEMDLFLSAGAVNSRFYRRIGVEPNQKRL